MCNFIGHCQTVVQSGSTILYSHQQCRRIPLALYFCHSGYGLFFSFFFFFLSHSSRCFVVRHCALFFFFSPHCGFNLQNLQFPNQLMVRNCFSCTYFPCAYHLWWSIYSNICPFLIVSYCWVWVVIYFSYILDINPLSDRWFANIFFQFLSCLFILLTVSFGEYMFSIWVKSNLWVFLW